jgi:hypothetical protein
MNELIPGRLAGSAQFKSTLGPPLSVRFAGGGVSLTRGNLPSTRDADADKDGFCNVNQSPLQSI